MVCLLQSLASAVDPDSITLSDLVRMASGSNSGFSPGEYSMAQLNKFNPPGADERIPGYSFVDDKQREIAGADRSDSTVIAASTQPDLSLHLVEGQPETACNQVSLEVTLTPSNAGVRSSGNVPVRVRVTDEIFGQTQTVGELVLYLPSSGGSVSATIEFPMPADASFSPDWPNEITVVVDPDNQITESDKTNNSAKVEGNCIG